jgi:hypothetical protein
MRSLTISCLIALALLGCLNEDRIDPAKASTFVRYINGGYDDDPKALVKARDGGYVILANTLAFPNYSDATEFTMDRVKLVKVDKYGTVEWTQILPKGRGSQDVGFHASGIDVYDGGYIISGEVIKDDGKTNFLIIQTNADGLQKDPSGNDISHFEIPLPSTTVNGVVGNVHGVAANWVGDNKLWIMGSISEFSEDLVLAEVDISSATPVVKWDYSYGGNPATLINRLYIDNGEMVFAGTITDPGNGNLKDGLIARAEENTQTIKAPLSFGDPALSEQANGMCSTLTGYAVVGSTTVGGKSDRDIFFARFAGNSQGAALAEYKTYAVHYSDTDPTPENDVHLNDEGNSICETADHGFIILATTESALTEDGSIGRGEKEYYLMRITNFGDVLWTKSFGSKREDIGVDVLQADDGGFMILGRTTLANVPTIALIKTDADGKID